MYKVIIDGELLYARDGELLSELLIRYGKSAEHPCGGRGSCKKCIVSVNGKKVLSCQYKIEADITVELSADRTIISESGADECGEITENLCFVLDLGTTTLALALVSLDSGKVIKVINRTNPQRIFGADVISRIDYCRKFGVSALFNAVTDEINLMISSFNVKLIEKLYVSGNATMLHLFFGVDCSSMGVFPYTPVFLESRIEDAEKLRLNNVKTVIALPSVATFVGADITAGLNYVGLPKKGMHSILIDLGTNAEIVLFSGDSALCTAAAAGPCFEGANISCGMSATDGAIYAFNNGKAEICGGVAAKGVCGTGLVDIIAYGLTKGIIDETGFMDREKLEVADGVSITQADVRQYQLAKSAVFSAIITLLRMKNVELSDIEALYISGGFSAKINIENAVSTGLLPVELIKKCVAVKNSSLLGTIKFAVENNDLSGITENTSYVDLSSDAGFSQLFIENMMFDA